MCIHKLAELTTPHVVDSRDDRSCAHHQETSVEELAIVRDFERITFISVMIESCLTIL